MLRDHAIGQEAASRAQLIERLIVMALTLGHMGEPVEDEPIGRKVGGHLIEMVGNAVPLLDQHNHVALLVGGEDAVLDKMGEGALELLTLLHDFCRRGGVVIRDAGARARLRRDPVHDIALQLFGMVDDQDHLKRAVSDQAAPKFWERSA